MSPYIVSLQRPSKFKIDLEKKIDNNQRGQTLGEFGIVLTGILILGILAGVYYFFTSQSSCERSGLTKGECAAAAGAGFPYADGEACFTLQDSLQQANCQNRSDCLQLPGVPRGSYQSEGEIEIVVIEAGVTYFLFENRATIDGCFNFAIDGANVTWESNTSGVHCEVIQYLQLWSLPLCKVQ